MKRFFGVLLALGLAAGLSYAQNVQLNPNQPGTYTVVQGDTLWDIAARFLAEPWRWPEIWEGNSQIENPHLIYPGDVISLTYRDGRPVLGLSRNVKLSPTIRAYERDRAIPPIPLGAIQPFLSRPLIVTEDEIDAAPYVVASQDAHLVSGSGNRIYVRGIESSDTNRYSIFRKGVAYLDHDNDNALLGYEALHIGDAVFERFGDPATAQIIRSNREILLGDRLKPQTEDPYLEFVPHAPDQQVNGSIISVIDGVSQIGQYHVVVLNLGTEAGIVPGHVLGIFQAGAEVADTVAAAGNAGNKKMLRDRSPTVALPEERAGELMVFRSFEKVSYGLVMSTQRPAHVFDRVKNP
jgi:hypothetical protein